ncbi:MAG: SIMPL domain-containing protein [Spirochaetaceae bacterium]|nr:SIMPL domain-containing protein [Spirochaetaceae bacterium]
MKKVSYLSIILIAIALLSSCSTLKDHQNFGGDSYRTISVSGTGNISVEPDMATFSVSISQTKETSAEALQATNKKVGEVLNALKEFNISDKDIKTTAINLNTEYEWIDNKQQVKGQKASQSINVKLKNLASIGPIIDKLSNINEISLGSINMIKEDTSEDMKQARILSVIDAKTKAQELANAAGMKLGMPLSISYGSSSNNNYNAPLMMKTSMKADSVSESYSTQAPTGEIELNSNVSIIYELIY